MSKQKSDEHFEKFAFAGDSDDDSEDDQIQNFNAKVQKLNPSAENLSDSDEESVSEGESSDRSDNNSAEAKLENEVRNSKIAKLHEQLNDLKSEEKSDSESENEEESDEQSEEEADNEGGTDEPVEHMEEVGESAKEDISVVDERQKYRSKLSKMSIGEIQRLKNKIGLKMFNQSLGISKCANKQQDFKRANKNRPRELTSKKTVGRFREIVVTAKQEKRDPRFDPLCGEFDEKIFKNSYKFVNDIKSQELEKLKKEHKAEEDPERKEQIKFLIQRIKNQQREERRRDEKTEETKELTKERKEMLRTGKKPYIMGKSRQKEFDLAAKYEKLKETGGLDNYIKKKTKKNVAKDRKVLSKLQ